MIYKNDLIKVVNKSLERDIPTEKVITAATQDNPCKITSTAHGYVSGDVVWVKDVVGMTEINNLHFTVTYVDADNFTIGVNASGYPTEGSGGTCDKGELDAEIIATLKDLSQLGNFLQDEFKRATITERDYYSLPDNFKDLLGCGLKSSDDATMYKDLVSERWAMYRRNIYYSSTPGTPTRYTWKSGYMYPRPIPDKVYNMYWWYAYYCPETRTVDSVEYKVCDLIPYNDIYREAIEMGLLYRVARDLGLDSDMKKYMGLYVSQVGIRKVNLKEETQVCAYRDGF